MTPSKIKVESYEVNSDEAQYPIEATKISFINMGNIPVYVGQVSIPPGDVYQVNHEHPHIIKVRWSIRFDTTATPADASLRSELALDNQPKLIIQTMSPE